MKEIRELSHHINDELCDALKYAKCYVTLKKDEPNNAKRYFEMANDEIKHANYLHEMVLEKINIVKSKDVDIPEIMIILWNEKHDEYLDKMAQAKALLAM